MTPEQIKLVQTSFAKVAPISEQAAAIFYARLFELDPSLRSLFKTDLKEQGEKLMQSLAFVVQGVHQPGAIVKPLQDLARRHLDYKVTEGHYVTVGQALLDTLERGLGKDFTPDVRQAWQAAYQAISEIMIQSAYPDSK